MRALLCYLTLLYEAAILLRIVFSWFPMSGGGVVAKINGFMITITDPVLAPLRRVLPSTGVFDLSPLVALLVLQIVIRGIILRC